MIVTLLSYACLSLALHVSGLSLPPATSSPETGSTFDDILHAAYTRYRPVGTYQPRKTKRQLNGLVDKNEGKVTKIKDSAVSIPLGDLDDAIYGEVSVGPRNGNKRNSPQQKFVVIFDTGSSDMLLPGKGCNGCGGGEERYIEHGKDETNTTKVPYGDGGKVDIIGHNYLDDVTIGNITSYKTVVTSMRSVPKGAFSGVASGLLGLAFSSLALNRQSSFIENLLWQSKLTRPEFAFFVGRKESKTKSSFQYGTRNESLYSGDFTRMVVREKHWWKVTLDDVEVKGDPIMSQAKGGAIFDTGTPVILVPKYIAKKIYNSMHIDAEPDTTDPKAALVSYTYRCTARIDVALVFAAKPFAIDPRDFKAETLAPGKGPQRCRGAIVGTDLSKDENTYVIGTPFLKNWYSVYNYGDDGGFQSQPTIDIAAAYPNQPEVIPSDGGS